MQYQARPSFHSPLVWPPNPVPRCHDPDGSFGPYHASPHEVIYDVLDRHIDLENTYQSCDDNWIEREMYPMPGHQLEEQACPPAIPDPYLQLSNTLSAIEWPGSLIQGQSMDCCNVFMPMIAQDPSRVMTDFEPGQSDAQSALPAWFENFCKSPPYVCQWETDGSPCNGYYPPSSNMKQAVSQHLTQAHQFLPTCGKSTQACLWQGCTKWLKQESIVRHILTVHLHITTACPACGTSFARQDSLQRHMKNSCVVGKRDPQDLEASRPPQRRPCKAFSLE